jgi:branched-chain amino acid transport system permease protein
MVKHIEGKWGWAALLLLGLAFPFLLGDNTYPLSVMAKAFVFALATIGLNLITGYTGQFNLAHSGFMAVGAYTVGILTVNHQMPYWWAFALSGLITAALGLPLGLISLRLKGHFFSIFTLCVGYIMFLVIEKWESLTNGTAGMYGIPTPTLGTAPVGLLLFDTPIKKYYLMLFFLVVGVWVMHRIVSSLLGRTFMAIRNSDELAESLGINLMRNKVLSFVLSVFYAGLAGGLYAGLVQVLGPDDASVAHTFDMTMYMLVGGLGTLLGPLLGALTIPWLEQSLQFLGDARYLAFGPMLIALVIFVPRGLWGSCPAWRGGAAPPTRLFGLLFAMLLVLLLNRIPHVALGGIAVVGVAGIVVLHRQWVARQQVRRNAAKSAQAQGGAGHA